MGILGAFKVLTQAKPILDYVFKANNLDKGQEVMVREIKVLKKEVERLHELTETHRVTLMDLIQSTHKLTIEKEKRDKLKKDLGK